MMCSYVDKLEKELKLMVKNEERFQSAFKNERVKRSELMIGIVDLKNRIERLESFMESIGACTECCHDPCRCERRVVVPDV